MENQRIESQRFVTLANALVSTAPREEDRRFAALFVAAVGALLAGTIVMRPPLSPRVSVFGTTLDLLPWIVALEGMVWMLPFLSAIATGDVRGRNGLMNRSGVKQI